MPDEERNVELPFPKWWHMYGNDIDPIKEVFPEKPLFNRIGQVFIGSTDESGIDLQRPGAAQLTLIRGPDLLGLL